MSVITMGLVISSCLLGAGLAMDAFSVSLANGLNEHDMKAGRMLGIAGTFAAFQFAMPVIGWFCVHKLAETFSAFQKFIPWIAFALLLYIGGKMLLEGIQDIREGRGGVANGGNSGNGEADAVVRNPADARSAGTAANAKKVALGELMVQGVATSIDALSVGFTIADYNTWMALISSLIIGIVTLAICLAGLALGRKFGTMLAGKAGILGGVILIGIGIKMIL